MKEQFLKYLQFEKRYSPHTQISYKNDLSQFYVFLKNNYPSALSESSQINHLIIRHWLIQLMEQKLKATSINRKIACLKSYFKFLQKNHTIDTDPTAKIISPKIPKRLAQFVDESQIDRLFNVDNFKPGFTGLRDRLVLEFLYGTGIRTAELYGMKINQLNLFDQSVRVIGKGNKERIIPIHKRLKTIIIEYLKERERLVINSHNYMIITENGKPAYPKLIYNIVNKYLSLTVNLDQRSPHVLRHTFATHLLNNGSELNAIKELLGHSNLATTQVYTHNSLGKLKKVFEQAHPKAV